MQYILTAYFPPKNPQFEKKLFLLSWCEDFIFELAVSFF